MTYSIHHAGAERRELRDQSAAPDSSDPSNRSARPHLPGLDGLRGLAILMVMVLHFGGGIATHASGADLWVSRFTGVGWIGVDLFFVLSGFLITGILYDTKGASGCLRNFYARRVLRIFPLYYGFLLVLFVIVPLLLARGSVPGIEQVGHNQGWLWLYCSNFGAVFISDKLFTGGLVQGGHFWSLAIEEQFYLVWPLIVLSLRRETLIKVCSAMIVAVLALRLGLVASGFERIYFFTPCRLDGLMAGALLSLVLRGQRTVQSLVPAAWKTLLACGAALAGIWLFKGLDSDHWTMTTVGFTLIAAFFTAATILVLAAPQESRRTRLFTGKTLTFLGKYSYGLYIFHSALEPTFRRYLSVNMLIERVFHHYWPARLAYMTMAMGISILVAWASWHVYEKQFLKLKRFFESRPALPVAQAAPVRVLKAA